MESNNSKKSKSDVKSMVCSTQIDAQSMATQGHAKSVESLTGN